MLKSRLTAIIARPSPGPVVLMKSLMAYVSRAAASAPAFVAGYGIAVLVLFAPKFHFFLLGALDASLAHLLVVLDLSLRKLTVLPEDDIETETEDT